MRSKILISAVLLMLPLTQSAFAQQGQPVVNPQRDCQTLLTCNYKKGGSYRGLPVVLFVPGLPAGRSTMRAGTVAIPAQVPPDALQLGCVICALT